MESTLVDEHKTALSRVQWFEKDVTVRAVGECRLNAIIRHAEPIGSLAGTQFYRAREAEIEKNRGRDEKRRGRPILQTQKARHFHSEPFALRSELRLFREIQFQLRQIDFAWLAHA